MKKENNKSFWSQYRWWFIGSIATLTIIYIVVYVFFQGNGVLSAGLNLEKKDWLSFLGTYLSFIGTVMVSLVATLQTKFFSEREEKKSVKEREKVLQPIFSISIEKIDSSVRGAFEVFNPSDKSTLPQHKNVTISLENVSEYPIRNVIIFEKYMYQLLKPNDKQIFQIAYSDSPDFARWPNHLVEVSPEHERTDAGVPKWFTVDYEDIDGNNMYQIFELKSLEGTEYYSLEDICKL